MNDLPYMGDDAYGEGFLSKKFGNDLIDRVNRRHKVKIPPNCGSAKFLESEEEITLDLTKLTLGTSAAAAPHRLSVINASTTSAGVTTPKVRVYLGFVAGIKADAGMTDPTDSPIYTLTLTSAVATKYIIATVTVGYSAGIWSASACAIGSGSSVPSNTATLIYVPLAIVDVVAIATGYTVQTSSANQIVSGDQWVARVGNASTYVDANGLI